MKDLNHLFGRIPIRTKLLILTIGLGTIPLLFFFLLTFMLGFSELRALSFHNLESDAKAIRNQATAYFKKIEQDVRYLSQAPFLQGYIANMGAMGENPFQDQAEKNFALLTRINPAYHQVRFIDHAGNEKIRIDQKGGKIHVMPRGQLQNKNHRYYFRETLKLKPGQVYVSPMDFNVEHGDVEKPRLPVFRYATQVWSGGKFRGVFIINVFGRSVLELLKAEANRSFESLSLLDQDGRVVVSGIDKQGRLHLTLDLESSFQDQTGMLAKLLSLESPWMTSPKGDFFVHLPINPLDNPPSKYWSLVLKGTRTQLFQPFFHFAYYSLGFLLLFGVLAVGVGLASARHFYSPLLRLKAGAREVSGGNYQLKIPINTNDELEDLAQDFTKMGRALESRDLEIQNHQKELENLVKRRTFQIALEKEKLERVVEGVNAGLGLFDRDYKLVWCNEFFSNLVQHHPHPVGTSCCQLLSGEVPYCGGAKAGMRDCSIRKAFSGQQLEMPTQEIKCPDGEKRTFLDRISPIRDGEGNVVYVLHILFDVTEKQRMEAREKQLQQHLMRAEKLATLGRFTAGIAHEIGNPLGIISTNAQAIQEDMEEGSPPWRQLEMIVSEIHRLSKITKDLNTFGKPSPPELLSHNPSDIMTGLRRLVEREAAAHDVKIETITGPCAGTIRVDAQQVQQVILNLVINAFEAMPEGGELKLEVRPKRNEDGENRLLFSVSDTGPGIAQEHLETIFDPFYTTKPQGTGFGLSLANTIVTQNGGGIIVLSTVGVGSTFTISFPFYPLEGAAEDAEKNLAQRPNRLLSSPMENNAQQRDPA